MCAPELSPECSRDGRDARWQMADGKQGTPASDLNGGLVGHKVEATRWEGTMRTIIACCNLNVASRLHALAPEPAYPYAHVPYSVIVLIVQTRINRIGPHYPYQSYFCGMQQILEDGMIFCPREAILFLQSICLCYLSYPS